MIRAGKEQSLDAGFTLIEVLVASVIMLAILAGIGTTLLTGRQATQQTTTIISLDDTMRTVLRRISEELRSASRSAEDTNGNTALDPGEDTNANLRFENDWSLSANAVTFNRLRSDGTFSLPITYRLNGSTLEYVKMTTAAGAQIVTPIASSVTSFTVVEATSMITITLAISAPSGGGATLSRTESINVTPRN
ncbi:MAG: prepilin-type N-terminal cleavage/methylation domain-containing protein [Planctomycetota bacterium]